MLHIRFMQLRSLDLGVFYLTLVLTSEDFVLVDVFPFVDMCLSTKIFQLHFLEEIYEYYLHSSICLIVKHINCPQDIYSMAY